MGPRALVTGVGAGIAREIAQAFVREGVQVKAVARTSSALQSLADELQAEGTPRCQPRGSRARESSRRSTL